jgi:small subunit ribosomal protein S9
MAKAKEDPYIRATGRRKTAVARVRIKTGSGKFLVNKRDLDAYFPTIEDRRRVLAALTVVNAGKSFDISVTIKGGGLTGQSGAICMGIARALARVSPENEKTLREGKFLTRDSRRKERKKYGRRGARRGFQFSKR